MSDHWTAIYEKFQHNHYVIFHQITEDVVSVLSTLPGYNWVGCYWIVSDKLHLGAWCGPAPTAHVEIPIGQGICGLAATIRETVIVDDVAKDPRYLQCFLNTKSEIVVPVFRDGDATKDVVGEIDIDGDQIAVFTDDDKKHIETVATKLGKLYPNGYDPRNHPLA